MSIKENLLYTKQARKFANRVAVVRPERLDIVQSTLRIAGFRLINNRWYLPKNHDGREWPVMYQKKSGGRWVFNLWYYDQWQKWIKENNQYLSLRR